jgi:Dolichyl-phosphate-mannose-protein mannosyltransferase
MVSAVSGRYVDPGGDEQTGLGDLKAFEEPTAGQSYGRPPWEDMIPLRYEPEIEKRAAVPARAAVHEKPRPWRLPSSWPLWCVLTVQAGLSARLIWLNTAFTDEALYLWAGRLEWQHWLHGTSIPVFPAYFSGAPVIYPPLGALAASIGGLAGARILSLCFMLGATSLLWAATSRLFGARAAFYSAALFALLGPTLKLGAFATYDAMSLCLLALAAWCAIHAGPRRDVGWWMGAAAISLALANATAYSSTILDPVVFGLVFLTGWPAPSAKFAAARAITLAAYVLSALILLFTLGGGLYAVGMDQTVLARVHGDNTPQSVLAAAAAWIGVPLVLGIAAVVLSLRGKGRRDRWLLVLLMGAAFLVPIEQARLDTLTSLDKHADLGAWFACMAAGYAVSRVTSLPRPRLARRALALAAVGALFFPARLGVAQAWVLFTAWPNSTRFIAAIRPLVDGTSGRLMVETPSIPEFYLPAGSQWDRWSTTSSFRLPDDKSISVPVGGVGHPDIYLSLIQEHYFSVIALDPGVITSKFDGAVSARLAQDPSYKMIDRFPYGHGTYTIWVYTGGAR